jgi:hypothetical protein
LELRDFYNEYDKETDAAVIAYTAKKAEEAKKAAEADAAKKAADAAKAAANIAAGTNNPKPTIGTDNPEPPGGATGVNTPKPGDKPPETGTDAPMAVERPPVVLASSETSRQVADNIKDKIKSGSNQERTDAVKEIDKDNVLDVLGLFYVSGSTLTDPIGRLIDKNGPAMLFTTQSGAQLEHIKTMLQEKMAVMKKEGKITSEDYTAFSKKIADLKAFSTDAHGNSSSCGEACDKAVSSVVVSLIAADRADISKTPVFPKTFTDRVDTQYPKNKYTVEVKGRIIAIKDKATPPNEVYHCEKNFDGTEIITTFNFGADGKPVDTPQTPFKKEIRKNHDNSTEESHWGSGNKEGSSSYCVRKDAAGKITYEHSRQFDASGKPVFNPMNPSAPFGKTTNYNADGTRVVLYYSSPDKIKNNKPYRTEQIGADNTIIKEELHPELLAP